MLRAYIGSFLFYVFLVTYTPVYATVVCLILRFFNVRTRYLLANYFNVSVVYMLRLLCGVKWHIKGLENLPSPEKGHIILGNHESVWETHAIPALMLPRQLCLVFKKEITYIPFFGWAMSALEMIPIDRSKGIEAFEQVRQRGGQRLREGAWMLFFPEGTRVPITEKRRYKTGGTRLAVATQTDVVPIAHNAADFWARKGFLKTAGTITMSIGKPISYQGHDADSMMEEVENWIRGELRVISPARAEPVARPSRK
jgi:1-acyl-sn-glycerol-3-phosphate acyltransferase